MERSRKLPSGAGLDCIEPREELVSSLGQPFVARLFGRNLRLQGREIGVLGGNLFLQAAYSLPFVLRCRCESHDLIQDIRSLVEFPANGVQPLLCCTPVRVMCQLTEIGVGSPHPIGKLLHDLLCVRIHCMVPIFFLEKAIDVRLGRRPATRPDEARHVREIVRF